MIPVLSAEETRQADAYTIQNEPIASIDLMERASHAFANKFAELAGRGHRLYVFCGTGNNGGDGLAVSRLLIKQGYDVRVFVAGSPEKGSPDFKTNLERLNSITSPGFIDSESHFPRLDDQDIVIDALFGSGLSRPLEGIYADLVSHINGSRTKTYSIDIASGLFADQPPQGTAIIQPLHTISFQCPKASFFHPASKDYTGQWHVVDIGLDQKFIDSLGVTQFYSEPEDFTKLVPRRSKFDHKGDAGKVKIIAGSKGKIGAAVLCARATLRTGSGLVFVQTPVCGRDVLQGAVPEAMVIEDKNMEVITGIEPGDYDAIALGPGLDTREETRKAIRKFLEKTSAPIIIDADGLNILSIEKDLLKKAPAQSILTPHPGEFRRLVGDWSNDFEKITLLGKFAMDHQFNVVLKGAFSIVCSSTGDIYYNCSGNPGMATGGSGDVLTGIIASLLGQIKRPFDALRLGVYLHGLAGDLAADKIGTNGMIASDIIDFLPSAVKKMQF